MDEAHAQHIKEQFQRKEETRKICRYNDAVRCWERTVAHCGKCGWSPAGERRRRRALHGADQQ